MGDLVDVGLESLIKVFELIGDLVNVSFLTF